MNASLRLYATPHFSINQGSPVVYLQIIMTDSDLELIEIATASDTGASETGPIPKRLKKTEGFMWSNYFDESVEGKKVCKACKTEYAGKTGSCTCLKPRQYRL